MKLKATLLAAVIIVAAVLACGGTETPVTSPQRETPTPTQGLQSRLPTPTTLLNSASTPATARSSDDMSKASPASISTIHIVQAGETLSGIAKQYSVSVEVLVATNNIVDPSLIRVGQTLVIPPVDVTATSPPTSIPAQASSRPIATSTAIFEEKEQMLLIFLESL